jgi:two-component system response regulator RegA
MSEAPITPKKLLVVDDDDLYRESLVRAFSRRQIHSEGVSNMEEALRAISTLSPDAAVVDLRLGHESGLDVVRRILSTNPEVKVIVLTAYGTIATALEAVRLGAQNYLTKPVDVDTILTAFDGKSTHSNTLTDIPTPEQVEWDYINKTVQDHAGNVTRAAQALGLHRRSLQRKLKNPPPLK